MNSKVFSVIGAAIISGSVAIMPVYAAEDAAPPPAALKIAVVNTHQVLQQSPKVVALSKKLEEQFKKRQQIITEGQSSLQSQMEQFKKEEPTMADKEKATAQKKLETERSQLLAKVISYQQDFTKEQSKIMDKLLSDVNTIVESIAHKDGYSLVLDAQSLVYAPNSTDITTTVSEQFNK